MSNLRRRLRWESLLWIVPAVFIGYRIWPQVAAAFGVASASAPAPPFQLTTLDGRTVTNEQLKGKVVLVNFWATWCPPCRLEMPGFESVYERNAGRDFVVLGVAMDAGGSDDVRKFLAERKITYPVAMATGEMVQQFGGVNLLPSSFLLDKQGRIRNEVRGIFASVALEQAVKRLIDEPGPATSAPTRVGSAR
ncbi:MAG TPA: TlpA disulfide reductase family protein [Gemmatimonadaceae bacterium]